MTDDIKKPLNKRSKLTKSYYKNDQQKLIMIKKINHLKNGYINKTTDKLQDPSTAPKTYWAIPSSILYNKKFQQYHQYLLMASLFQIFVKRKICLIIYFHKYVHQYKI